MNLFAGLASITALSLFFAWALKRHSALMPLLSVAVCMLFFTLAGCLGLLQAAGWLWYAACAGLLALTIVKTKKDFAKLVSPGLIFFVAGSALFIILFSLTRPMLTHWDEFTFWGTAAKVTCESNQLYTVARSSLIARSYPPGLIVYSYMMQFFGGFSEHGYIAAYAIFYLAAFAAPTALWGKNKTASLLFMAALCALPLFFETNWPSGQMMWAYLSCMADMPMAVLFGGALCFYFAGGEKTAGLWLPFAGILAALCCVKDMGLALALIALFVALLDAVFCELDRLAFFKLKRWAALGLYAATALALIAAAYFGWAAYMQTAGMNRFNLGSQGESLGMVDMLLAGIKALFGIQADEQFTQVVPLMLRAFFRTPVFLLGTGAVMLAIIIIIMTVAWIMAATPRRRRRVLVFAFAMVFCFAAFYVFNIFTYSFVFAPAEALVLKDYARYISPFWVGWLMASLTLLASTAVNPKGSFYRLRAARALSGAAAVFVLCAVALRANWHANFLNVSPAFYGERLNLRAVTQAATGEGMQPEDDVYIISQGDDGTRFYMFGFDLPAVRTLLYSGVVRTPDGEAILDEDGRRQYYRNASVTFIPKDATPAGPFEVVCRPEDFAGFLKQEGCTHVLLDRPDEYILAEFAPLFADGLEGWSMEGTGAAGRRYYRVTWNDEGECLLVPQEGTAT